MQRPAIRRKDRERSNTEALTLLQEGEWGTLALVDENGLPYSVPLSYAMKKDEGVCIIFHMALDGYKIRCMNHEPQAVFTVVGKTEVLPSAFSTRYVSAMAFGRLQKVTDAEQKLRFLHLLAQKYSPGLEKEAQKYIQSKEEKTGVWLLHVDSITAKGRA